MQNLLTLAVLGFAAYRATQFVLYDTLADPWRAKLEMWHVAKFDSKIRKFIRDLLSCLYCIGFWLSALTVAVYLTAADEWGSASIWIHLIEVWAVAGMQAGLNRLDS